MKYKFFFTVKQKLVVKSNLEDKSIWFGSWISALYKSSTNVNFQEIIDIEILLRLFLMNFWSHSSYELIFSSIFKLVYGWRHRNQGIINSGFVVEDGSFGSSMLTTFPPLRKDHQWSIQKKIPLTLKSRYNS